MEDDLNFWEKEKSNMNVANIVGNYDESPLHIQAERALLPVAQSYHLSKATASVSNQF